MFKNTENTADLAQPAANPPHIILGPLPQAKEMFCKKLLKINGLEEMVEKEMFWETWLEATCFRKKG